MKKVVLTGSTGLIGKEAIKPLEDLGFEVYCLTSKNCDIFNYEAVKKFFKDVKAEYLLHFAWFTGEGYLESELNPKFLDASMNLLKTFKANGGKRAIFAGTCFEYKFDEDILKEDETLNPTTLYAKCKCELHNLAEKFCKENDISFGWGRIFYVYGINEAEKRLGGALLNKLSKNEIITISCGQLIRDYVYTKDIAGAFCALLNSKVEGSVNVSHGSGITLEEFAKVYAKKLGKEKFLKIEYNQTSQPLKIIGDEKKLINEVGFKFQYDLENSIDEIIKSIK